MKLRARTFKGTRDHLPPDMIRRQWVFGEIRKYFERYGFLPLETPAIEYADILLDKYGEDAEQLIYSVHYDRPELGLRCEEDGTVVWYSGYYATHKDDDAGGTTTWAHTGTGEDAAALRYDLTIPLARVINQHRHKLPIPFRRYQMQPVWRADRPQIKQGRFREFYQCDVDVVGTDSLIADAEILSLNYEILQALRVGDFVIRINHRKILRGILERVGVAHEHEKAFCQVLDKLHKVEKSELEKELQQRGFPPTTTHKIFDILEQSKHTDSILDTLKHEFRHVPTGLEGVHELEETLEYVKGFEVPAHALEIDISLARGLEYYTGCIYESSSREFRHVGSLSGGGRYDNLMESFGGERLPAVGATLGFDRILTLLEQKEHHTSKTTTQILLARFEDTDTTHALRIVQRLRRAGYKAELYYTTEKISKQLSYAHKQSIPYVILFGKEEQIRQHITVKSFHTGTQDSFPEDQLEAYFQDKLE